MAHSKSKSAYRRAGVDIDLADRLVRRIQPLARRTSRPEVLAPLGGFGGLFRMPSRRMKNPVLVAGTDGVGTKLKIAFRMNRHDTVGIDLVAMCVNDVVVTGAEPLFFLDYLATGKIRLRQGEDILRGITRGCRQAGCALIGGEVAEMPSMYADGEYDLAGFSVGMVEQSRIVDGKRIRPGDILIGLASSGLHSNGYSLVRKVFFEKAGWGIRKRVRGLRRPLGEVLLIPTRIYVRSVLELLSRPGSGRAIKGMAHITGGGISGNLPRILPSGCAAMIDRSAWKVPPVFRILQQTGNINTAEMFRTFNMGIGLMLVVSRTRADEVLAHARDLGEKAFILGRIVDGRREVCYA